MNDKPQGATMTLRELWTTALAALLLLALAQVSSAKDHKMDAVKASTASEMVCEKIKPLDVNITGPSVTASQIEACENAGGEVTETYFSSGLMKVCKQSYCDAGEVCSDNAQCIGMCLANLDAPEGETMGVCQSDNLLPDCFAQVENGKRGWTVCQ